MATKPTPTADRVRALASALDCMTSEELRELAGITELTEEAWRKRHTGPAYVVFGRNIFYPRKGVREHFERLLRERGVPGRSPL